MMSFFAGLQELSNIALAPWMAISSPDTDEEFNGKLLEENIKEDSLSGVRILLESKVNPNQRVYSDRSIYSPLYCAIKKGSVEMVRLLLDAKANPNHPSWFGDNITVLPLFSAASRGSLEIVRLLLDAKADVTIKAPNSDGRMYGVLYYATASAECLRMLLDAKADPLGEASPSDLMYQIIRGLQHRKIRQTLKSEPLGEAPTSDLMYENIRGSQEDTQIIQTLLDLKVGISHRDKFGKTPLHYATENDDCDSIQFLLEHKASIFEKTKDGKNIIDFAKEKHRHPELNDHQSYQLRLMIQLLETEMISAKQKQSTVTLTGLHRRAGAQSLFANLAKRSTIFEPQTLRLVLRLAGSKMPSRKRKRENAAEAAAINLSLGSRK